MQSFFVFCSLIPWMVTSSPLPQFIAGRSTNPALAAVNPALAALNPSGGMPNMMQNLNNMLSDNLNRMNEVSASFARGKPFQLGNGNAAAIPGVANHHRHPLTLRNGETVNAASEHNTLPNALSAAAPAQAPVPNLINTQVQPALIATPVVNPVSTASGTISTPFPDPVILSETPIATVAPATSNLSAVPSTTSLPADTSLAPSVSSTAQPVATEIVTPKTSMDDPSKPAGSELKGLSSSPYGSSSYNSIDVSHATFLYPKIIFLLINVFMSFCLVVIFFK